jgi:serine/threonine protein kinase
MPKFLSPQAIDLINRLLDRHPMKRLGAGPKGAQDIKEHAFFDEIDWDDIINKKTFPPVRKRKTVKHKEIPIEEFLDPENINILQREKLKLESWSFAKVENSSRNSGY